MNLSQQIIVLTFGTVSAYAILAPDNRHSVEGGNLVDLRAYGNERMVPIIVLIPVRKVDEFIHLFQHRTSADQVTHSASPPSPQVEELTLGLSISRHRRGRGCTQSQLR